MSSDPGFVYVGEELKLFAHADTWKDYIGSVLQAYLAGDVLEVGAGTGATTKVLNRGGASSWTCLEPDRSLAAGIPENAQGEHAPVSVVVGTLWDVPESRKFDTIAYIDVLEHIDDDRSEIVRAAELLKPDGRIVVLSPAYNFLFSPYDRQIGHYRRYTSGSLRRLAAGILEVEKTFYLDAAGVAALLVNKALLRQNKPSLGQVRFWDRRIVPVSKVLDGLIGHRFGRSVVGVFRKPGPRGEG